MKTTLLQFCTNRVLPPVAVLATGVTAWHTRGTLREIVDLLGKKHEIQPKKLAILNAVVVVGYIGINIGATVYRPVASPALISLSLAIKHLGTYILRLRTKNEQLTREIDDINKKLGESNQTISEKTNANESLEGKLRDSAGKVSELEHKISAFNKTVDELKKKNKKLSKENLDLNSKLSLADQEVLHLKNVNDELKKHIDEMKLWKSEMSKMYESNNRTTISLLDWDKRLKLRNDSLYERLIKFMSDQGEDIMKEQEDKIDQLKKEKLALTEEFCKIVEEFKVVIQPKKRKTTE